MAQTRNAAPGSVTLAGAQHQEPQADYSYDQWRHAQMRQLEQSYAAALGFGGTPAAA